MYTIGMQVMGRKRVDSKQLAVRLSKATWQWLEAEAAKTDNTASGLIRDGIRLLIQERRLLGAIRGGMESSGISYPTGDMVKPDGTVSKKQLTGLNFS